MPTWLMLPVPDIDAASVLGQPSACFVCTYRLNDFISAVAQILRDWHSHQNVILYNKHRFLNCWLIGSYVEQDQSRPVRSSYQERGARLRSARGAECQDSPEW